MKSKSLSALKKSSSILIYGIGNPSRQDDALGVLFTDAMREWAESMKLSNITFDSNYQLNVEDALDISEKDLVIFVDASVEPIEDFLFRPLKSSKTITFTTHSLKPESVIALCNELFGKKPKAYLLTIKGYSWELSEPMTERARANLGEALKFTKSLIAGKKCS
jgi:hydrogenase maturation protease